MKTFKEFAAAAGAPRACGAAGTAVGEKETRMKTFKEFAAQAKADGVKIRIPIGCCFAVLTDGSPDVVDIEGSNVFVEQKHVHELIKTLKALFPDEG